MAIPPPKLKTSSILQGCSHSAAVYLNFESTGDSKFHHLSCPTILGHKKTECGPEKYMLTNDVQWCHATFRFIHSCGGSEKRAVQCATANKPKVKFSVVVSFKTPKFCLLNCSSVYEVTEKSCLIVLISDKRGWNWAEIYPLTSAHTAY